MCFCLIFICCCMVVTWAVICWDDFDWVVFFLFVIWAVDNFDYFLGLIFCWKGPKIVLVGVQKLCEWGPLAFFFGASRGSSGSVSEEIDRSRESAITAPPDSQDMEYRKVKDEVPFSSFPLSLSSLTCLYIKKLFICFKG